MSGQTNGGVYNPKNLSLFTYTYNNPINFIDPTGMLTEEAANNQVNKFQDQGLNMTAVQEKHGDKNSWMVVSPDQAGQIRLHGGEEPKYGFSEEFIKKTNNKVGDDASATLVKSDKYNVAMLNLHGELGDENNMISAKADGNVGKFTLPNISAKKDFKKRGVAVKAGAGFNTFEGQAGGQVNMFGANIKFGVRGAMGGLSAKGSVSVGRKGFKADVMTSVLFGGGGYIDVDW